MDERILNKADNDLEAIDLAIRERRRILASRELDRLKVGDRVRFNGLTSPKYLQRVEATVTEKSRKSVTVEIDKTVGKFAAGVPIRAKLTPRKEKGMDNDTDTQRIYYDADDDIKDGNGWNIVDASGEGAVSLRYPTVRLAVAWCRKAGLPFWIDGDPVDVGLKWDDATGWTFEEESRPPG